jgi:hypothetical protein
LSFEEEDTRETAVYAAGAKAIRPSSGRSECVPSNGHDPRCGRCPKDEEVKGRKSEGA